MFYKIYIQKNFLPKINKMIYRINLLILILYLFIKQIFIY